MDNQDCDHKHFLVMVLQILQKFLGFLAECHKVGRQDVHIKTGADSPFLFVDLCLVQITQLALDCFQSGILVEGFGMDADDLASLHVQNAV